MLNNMFSSILENGFFTGEQFLAATFTALVCGIVIAAAYMLSNHYSKSFVTTLVLLPPVVAVVIALVNGNIGAGVAVAGAFSLVRFRSAPGKGQEITSIFLAMTVGLAAGMGYLGVAILFSILISIINLALNLLHFGESHDGMRLLRITVPENLDFENRFEDIFAKYLKYFHYEEVKTTNMGSLYKISLRVLPKPGESVKEFLDELRTRNGNLEISLGRILEDPDSL